MKVLKIWSGWPLFAKPFIGERRKTKLTRDFLFWRFESLVFRVGGFGLFFVSVYHCVVVVVVVIQKLYEFAARRSIALLCGH